VSAGWHRFYLQSVPRATHFACERLLFARAWVHNENADSVRPLRTEPNSLSPTKEDSVAQNQPKIIAWMKPSCGWSNGVRAVLRKYGLEYEDRDIINNPDHFFEMVRVTGQRFQPSLQIGDVVLADISGEELEEWLIDHGIVEPVKKETDVPLDRGCVDHSEPATFVRR